MIAYPFIVAVLPVLVLFSGNAAEVPWRDLVPPLLILLAFTALATWALRRFLSKEAAALSLTVFLVFLFLYGPAVGLVAHLPGMGTNLLKHRFFIPIYGLGFLLVAAILFRFREPLRRSTRTMERGAAILLATALLQLGYGVMAARGDTEDGEGGAFEPLAAAPAPRDSSGDPDIFFIVADGYAGKEALREFFGYDNSSFLDRLREKGFQVMEGSRSNYAMTGPSLTSTLNMDYLRRPDSLARAVRHPSGYFRKAIEDNRLVAFLKARGYEFIHFDSGEWVTAVNRRADVTYETGLYSEFERQVIHQTVLAPFLERFLTDKRRRIEGIMTRLESLAPKGGRPRFVFAHLLVPHPPYVFGPRGEWANAWALGDGWDKAHSGAYLNQLLYVNMRLEALLDRLGAGASQPVIVLQSDHGSAFQEDGPLLSGWNGDPRAPIVRERMSILNAVRIPGKEAPAFPPGTTPVNTFRVLLDRLFGTGLGLLENRSFFSTYADPFGLTEVPAESPAPSDSAPDSP